ncbi:hypothetical protein SAMN04488057_103103 [Cyclobacterium lianum]|uniref:Uncharacterized protein n=1 Tax=Cyclobacterium lianum TaxID=388280 RepID=A0A1M7L685_9BACT|nr:hypothetical protein SAMN04488057_103103 [Cyclobacterium lianum]
MFFIFQKNKRFLQFSFSCVYNLLFSCHIACPDPKSGESRYYNHLSVGRVRHARFHCIKKTGETGSINIVNKERNPD